MRKILSDTEGEQVQADGKKEYVFRKEFLYKGDMKDEYSLILTHSRPSFAEATEGGHGTEICPCAEVALPVR